MATDPEHEAMVGRYLDAVVTFNGRHYVPKVTEVDGKMGFQLVTRDGDIPLAEQLSADMIAARLATLGIPPGLHVHGSTHQP